MSDSDKAKAAREREVFDLFRRLTKYPVDHETITQDAPDISCKLQNGEAATFELVTIDSVESSREWGNFYSSPSAWHRAIRALPEERISLYLERFKGTRITPSYSERAGQREAMNVATTMMESLLQKPAGFLGRVDCGQNSVLVEALPNGNSRGPFLIDSMSPDVQPVVWDRIRGKVEKRYGVSGIFELIAYSYRDTLFHQEREDAQPPTEQIREWLRNSPFRRVWIVEVPYKQIYRRIDRPG